MPDMIKHCIDNRLAKVKLNRPDLHNAFDDAMIAQLTHAMETLGQSDSVRVIILCAEGRSFSAGADLNWMRHMVDYCYEENVTDAAALARMLRAIRDCPKPVIARVQGAAFGGGVGLVAACDLAVALSSATFCLSEVKLGLVPAVISPLLLEKIGMTHARRYALTAERFDATEAQRIGLLTHVARNADEMDAWIGMITKQMLRNGPQALACCKKLLTAVDGRDWDATERVTTRGIAEIRVSDEGQEGLKAFLGKRSPKWSAMLNERE